MKIVLATGGFDPLHSGHISYLQNAKALGDYLIVGVNSDAWLTRKKGRAFMPIKERVNIIEVLSMVDEVYEFDEYNDADGSCIKFIENVLYNYPKDEIIFANGGDRNNTNIPEMSIEDPKLRFEFGVGGINKANSSSWILEEWKSPKTKRDWGYYRVLHEEFGIKVKELTIDPESSLSFQRHFERNEYWLISQGVATIVKQATDNDPIVVVQRRKHEDIHIPIGSWHKIINETKEPLKIVEIQYGENCVEEDIERKIDLYK